MNKSESKYFNTAVKMNEALVTLLEKKDFHYITVSEICQTAGVNRSTFYLHYENTTDLLEETTSRMIQGFLAYFQVDRERIAARFSQCSLEELNYITEDYLHPYLSYIREKGRILSTALAHTQVFRFDSIYREMFEYIFDPILARFHYPEGDRKYVMRFYLNGVFSVVTEWFRNGCDKSIEDMVRIIRECVFGLDMSLQEKL